MFEYHPPGLVYRTEDTHFTSISFAPGPTACHIFQSHTPVHVSAQIHQLPPSFRALLRPGLAATQLLIRMYCEEGGGGHTRVRSAPASISNTAAAACAESIAKWSGVLPAGNL